MKIIKYCPSCKGKLKKFESHYQCKKCLIEFKIRVALIQKESIMSDITYLRGEMGEIIQNAEEFPDMYESDPNYIELGKKVNKLLDEYYSLV